MWTSKVKLNKKGMTDEEVYDQIRKYLKRSGIGDNAKYRRILKYAYDHEGHFPITELQKNGVITSDMNKLVKAGFLTRVCVDHNTGKDGRCAKHTHLYEGVIGNNKPPHSHLTCVVCGSMEEFDDTLLRNTSDKICDYFEFERHQLQLQILGRCKNCIKKLE